MGEPALQVIPSPWTPQESLDWVGRNTFCVRDQKTDKDGRHAGWYFYDETYSEHGPFESQDEAVRHLLNYCELYL